MLIGNLYGKIGKYVVGIIISDNISFFCRKKKEPIKK